MSFSLAYTCKINSKERGVYACMRVQLRKSPSSPIFPFIFFILLSLIVTPPRSRYDPRIDNSTSLSTPLTLTTIFFSKFHTFSRDFFHRCFSMVGLPSCHLDFSGEELDLGIRSLFFDEDFRQLDSFYSSTRGHSTNSSTSGLSRILWTYS